jgi:energy-coupling factor transporter transmembrane protein EcfT
MGAEEPEPTPTVPSDPEAPPRRRAFWSVLICSTLAAAVALSGFFPFPPLAQATVLMVCGVLVVIAFFAPEMPLRRVLRPAYLVLAVLCGLLVVAILVSGIIGYVNESRWLAEMKRTGQFPYDSFYFSAQEYPSALTLAREQGDPHGTKVYAYLGDMQARWLDLALAEHRRF